MSEIGDAKVSAPVDAWRYQHPSHCKRQDPPDEWLEVAGVGHCLEAQPAKWLKKDSWRPWMTKKMKEGRGASDHLYI